MELTIRAVFVTIQLAFISYCFQKASVFKFFDSKIVLYLLALHIITNVFGFILFVTVIDLFYSIIQPINNVVHQMISPLVFIGYYHNILKDSPNQKYQKIIGALFVLVFPFLFFREGNSMVDFDFFQFIFVVLIIFLCIVNFFIDFLFHKDFLSVVHYFPLWISLSLFTVYIVVMPILFAGRFISDEVYLLIYYGIITIAYSILMYGIQKCKNLPREKVL